jgi:hypothetical protein
MAKVIGPRLTNAEKFKLWAWVGSVKAKIEAEKWTAAKVLDQAKAATGIVTLSEKYIRQACEATGTKLMAVGNGTGGLRPWIAKVQALEARVVQLEATVKAISEQDHTAIEELRGRLESLEVSLGVAPARNGYVTKELLGRG